MTPCNDSHENNSSEPSGRTLRHAFGKNPEKGVENIGETSVPPCPIHSRKNNGFSKWDPLEVPKLQIQTPAFQGSDAWGKDLSDGCHLQLARSAVLFDPDSMADMT